MPVKIASVANRMPTLSPDDHVNLTGRASWIAIWILRFPASPNFQLGLGRILFGYLALGRMAARRG